ncbi:MAG: 3'(2'),5'-bisphosphate nucleotidase CysQ [Gammaproteobacteria bacterium]|nr:3'(2'),5'-bisphosphate nucleotidase CysQ [Gammaproteobacteria bacterium]
MNRRLQQVARIARAAGREILEVYHAADVDAGGRAIEVETKSDGSPLTQADRRAHDLIHAQLARLAPDIPLLSEESDAEAFAARRAWRKFWLVDPLDGTRGFIKRNDQFTVNIALIDAGRPALGVVYAPLTGLLYAADADAGDGAFKVTPAGADDGDGATAAAQRIRVKPLDIRCAVMATSRAHGGPRPRTHAYRARLAAAFDRVDTVALGSSLKICLVADGAVDIYPRLSPTSEWDTAAAHCVLQAAGGDVTDVDGVALRYNKADILNPWFLAGGARDFDWAKLARGLA